MNFRNFFALGLCLLPAVSQAVPMHHRSTNSGSYVFSIDLELAGVKKNFVVDTGAYFTTVAYDTQTVGFTRVGEKGFEGALGKVTFCDEVSVTNANIGALDFENLRSARCANRPRSEVNNLGMDWLDGRVLGLIFSEAQLTMSEPTEPLANSFRRGSQGHIILPVKIAGLETAALFDTGCSTTIVDPRIIKNHPEDFTRLSDNLPGIEDSSGITVRPKYYRVNRLKVGPLDLSEQTVMTFNFSKLLLTIIGDGKKPVVVLGSNSIVYADWFFDLKSNTWDARLRTK